MRENQRYAFVLDIRGIKLSPTKEEKAWYKVRKKKAKVIQVKPLIIQLNYRVDNIDNSEIYVGLDVGETTGVGVVQKCKTKNKVIFKGEIKHRKDVSKLMEQRRNYRRLRRTEKRYRPVRFDNRGSSKKKERLTPSIKTRQDEIIRFMNKLLKLLNIDKVIIEDVSFDIRALTDGYTPYRWDYQKSNRLDENIRKSTLMRDKFVCQMCGATNTLLEAHHITPKRQNGEDTVGNLITLCNRCHKEVTGKEDEYKEVFYRITKGKQIGLRYASHVMQGKNYLYRELSKLVQEVSKTDGGTTANRRIDWCIEKSHSNDGIVITGLKPDKVNLYEYIIKPLRKKRKCKTDKNLELVQGDRVYYKPRDKKKIECYVKAILQNGKLKGYYNLKDYKGNSYGPASPRSLRKISEEKGISII
jgi:hypothetical protein